NTNVPLRQRIEAHFPIHSIAEHRRSAHHTALLLCCYPTDLDVSSGCPKEIPRMKILLIDDHVLIRDALRGVLKELQDDATILEAADCRQAMRLIEANPDLHLVLLDLNLPDRDGFAFLADLRRRYAAISLVVLSAFHERDNVLKVLDLGALGFIPKSA